MNATTDAEHRQSVDRAIEHGEQPPPDDSELRGDQVAPQPGPRLQLLPRRHTKVVHLIRHGQGYHNIVGEENPKNYGSWDYEDAHLTPKGWEQAADLKRHIGGLASIRPEVVIVSPLTRTMETAVGAFGGPVWHDGDAELPLMQEVEGVAGRSTAHPAVSTRGTLPFVAFELCREQLGEHPCDKRRSLAVYREQFPGVDFSLIESEEDIMWKPDVREAPGEIAARGFRLLQWLIQRPESEIAVVAHSSILHHTLLNFVRDAPESVQPDLTRLFGNCELRTMVLSDVSPDGGNLDATWFHPEGLHKQNGVLNGGG